ncbi:hypothetical protein [Qipengyuania atrilutea]|uniref:Uncharacterized protein n=1 Tax=Qipengyuania atrilutea TaxID=2744473 RepID=A0A850HFD9_9SPHN|nr:hypothetical protein [Actirhodobacter atriluteus]NVD46059.1 hypothetical protein [Actirhodobacter atriluteus]
MPFPHIGQRLGGRDHSTIIAGYRKIEMLRGRDEDLRAATDFLVVLEIGDAAPVPQDLLDRLAALAKHNRDRRLNPHAVWAQWQRQVNAEVSSYPMRLPSRLNLGLIGEAGDPLCGSAAIEDRR